MIRRLFLSFFAGLFLLAAIVGPAAAVIPVGVYAGTVIRGIIAGAGTRAAIPAAGNAAKALSASGLFGVSAMAVIVMCGQNAIVGNDCSGAPVVKFRPQNQTGNGDETAAQPQAPTDNSYAATQALHYRYCSNSSCSGTNTGWYLSAADACAQSVPVYTAVYGAGQTWLDSPTYDGPGGAGCKRQNSNMSYFPPGTAGSGLNTAQQYHCPSGGTLSGSQCLLYTCPSGYTLTGGSCVPATGNWAADGVPSYRNQAGVWIGDPADPDPYTPIANPLVSTNTTPDGKPMRVETIANADGSVTVRTFTEGSTAGNTTTTVNEMRVSATGTPTAVTNIYFGDLTTVVNQAAPTTQTPAPGEIEIPTDYARDATVQTTNTKLQTIITDGLKIKEEGTPTGADAYKGADVTSTVEALKGVSTTVSSAEGKDTGWKISFTPPTTCTNPPAFVLPHAGINWTPDLCAYEGTIHLVTGFLWVLLTVGSCLTMIRSTMTGGA